MRDEITLNEYIAVAFRHDVEALVGLAADRAHRSFLNNILQGHRVQHTESKLNTQFEALVRISILHGINQDGGGVAEEVGVVL